MAGRARSGGAYGVPGLLLITGKIAWIDAPAAVASAAIVVVRGVFSVQQRSIHVVVAWVSRAVKDSLDSPVGSTLYASGVASGVTPDPFKCDAT
jgi:hypothetical protein